MRISSEQQKQIKNIVSNLIRTDNTSIILFGSRVNDNARGGDVDLLIDIPAVVENPAWLAAQISAKLSRLFEGRSVDVLLNAPNLKKLPIHDQAKSNGILL